MVGGPQFGFEVNRARPAGIVLTHQGTIVFAQDFKGFFGNRLNQPGQVSAGCIEIGPAMDAGDFKGAILHARQTNDAVEKAIKLHSEAINILRITWNKLADAKAIGADASNAEKLLELARESIKVGEYEKAIEFAKKSAADMVEKLTSQ